MVPPSEALPPGATATTRITSEVRLRSRDDILETRAWMLPSNASADHVFLLIHGVGLSHRVYGRLAAHLAEYGRVVGVDLPGFGGIRRPASPVSVNELAECVSRAMSDANVESAIVIGHSMGAQIALELALIVPRRVDALVLIGPVVNPRRHTLLQQGLALAHDSALEPLATKLRVSRDYLSCGAAWFLTEAREMMRYRTHAEVARLQAPLLVIRGEHDVIAPADWCEWLGIRGGAGPTRSVAGHRHVVIHTAPGPTADLIAEFASSVWTRNAR